MFESDQTEIPEGCHFIGWFDIARSPEELAQMFESAGWHAQPNDRGYTLTHVTQSPATRSHPARTDQKILALVTATPYHPNILSGHEQCPDWMQSPDWMGREIRELLWRFEQQSNTLIWLWRDHAGGVWRDIPATAELLGLDPGLLSDADRTAITTGYISRQVIEPAKGKRASYPHHDGASFLFESVVVDGDGIRLYKMFRGISRIEWHQIQEVSAEWICSMWTPVPYATITGDGIELIIQKGCTGYPALLDALAMLPGFPMKKFCESLNTTQYDDKEVVWRRSVAERNDGPDNIGL